MTQGLEKGFLLLLDRLMQADMIDTQDRIRLIQNNGTYADIIKLVMDKPHPEKSLVIILNISALFHNREVAESLLMHGVNPNHIDCDALPYSVRAGDLPMVDLLFAHGAILNCAITRQYEAIAHAVCSNNMPMLNILLTHTNIAKEYLDKLLGTAVGTPHMDMIRLLLEMGATPHNDVFYEIRYHVSLDMIKLLLDHWPTNEPIDYELALEQVIDIGHLDSTTYLLERADQTINYNTLLSAALRNNNIDIVKVLLGYGADPIHLSINMRTIKSTLHYAVLADCAPEIIELLLEFHDMRVHHVLIETACDIALRENNITVAETLLDYLPQTSYADHLSVAIDAGNLVIVEMLIKKYNIVVEEKHCQLAREKQYGLILRMLSMYGGTVITDEDEHEYNYVSKD